MKIDLIFPRWQVDLSNSAWSGISEGVGRTGRTTEVGVVGVTPRTTTEVGVVGTTATTKEVERTRTKTFMPKATVIGTTATTKEVERTRTKTIMPKATVIGTTATIQEVEPIRTKRIMSKAAAVGIKKAGAMMSEKAIFGSHNGTAHQIENRLRKSLNISPLTLRSDARCR